MGVGWDAAIVDGPGESSSTLRQRTGDADLMSTMVAPRLAVPLSMTEKVTPRIDSIARCRCSAEVIFDEVFGWLHVAGNQAAAEMSPAHVPGPAAKADPTGPS
jgi:hypothetical protein